MAAGVAVMGFGGGAIVGSPLAALLIVYVGAARCLAIMAVVFLLLMLPAAQFLRFPSSVFQPPPYLKKEINLIA